MNFVSGHCSYEYIIMEQQKNLCIFRGINSELYLQINRSPSFGTDEKIDFDIKSALIEDTVRLLNIKYVYLNMKV